jgi:hypothetical protein
MLGEPRWCRARFVLGGSDRPGVGAGLTYARSLGFDDFIDISRHSGVRRVRDRSTDLFNRPAAAAQPGTDDWGPLMPGPIERLTPLADLCVRGLLSRDEFGYQRSKVLMR